MKLLVPVFLLLAPMASSGGTNLVFRSGPDRVDLVELFTSEGCSSCPPADKWMSKLRSGDGLWKQFVPVAFHVDYWNRLGWPDRFSSHVFTGRQRGYVRDWKSDTMYTPCIVVDGQVWGGWRAGGPPVRRPGRAGSLEIKPRGTNWTVNFSSPETGSWSYCAALLGCGIEVNVTAGENAGRTLRHDFVVLAFTNGPLAGTALASAEFSFASPNDKPGETAIAAWITRRDALRPVQAAGGYLPRRNR